MIAAHFERWAKMNAKRTVLIVVLFLGCTLLFVVKPRIDLSRDYQRLVAKSPPLALTKASDTEIKEIEHRIVGWTVYTDAASKYVYGEHPPFIAGMHPIDGFVYLMTHEAPRLNLWHPESSRTAIILLTQRAVLSSTISGGGTVYFEGDREAPSRVFTMRPNSSVILNRNSNEIQILVTKNGNEE